MSATLHPVLLWSPQGVAAFDPRRHQSATFPTVAEAGTWLGKGRTVVVALGRRASFVKAVRLPDLPVSELRQIVALRLSEYFPSDGREWAFDLALGADLTAEGRLCMVAAMPSAELKQAIDEIVASGLFVNRTVPAAAASVAMAIGPRTIVAQKSVEGIAFDIVEHGVVIRSRVVAAESNPDAELRRSLAMVEGDHEVVAVRPLALSGATEVEAGDLETLARTSLSLNIEPMERVRDRRSRQIGTARRQSAILALAAIALGTFVYLEYDDASQAVDKQRASMNASLNKLRKERDSIQAEANKLNTTKSTLERAFAPAQTPFDVFSVVTNALPDGAWLTGMTYERGKPMQLRGTSRQSGQVGQYLETLSAESRVRDVRLIFANDAEIEGTPVVQFSLTAFPVGNLPLVDVKRRTR